MSFENIKEGDYVMSQIIYSYGFKTYSFWVRRKVEKTTPKRFTVGGRVYSKADGRLVGDGYDCVCPDGSKEDQTQEYKEFHTKCLAANAIKNAVVRFDPKFLTAEEAEELTKIAARLLEIKQKESNK